MDMTVASVFGWLITAWAIVGVLSRLFRFIRRRADNVEAGPWLPNLGAYLIMGIVSGLGAGEYGQPNYMFGFGVYLIPTVVWVGYDLRNARKAVEPSKT